MKKRTKTWVRILAVFLAVLLMGGTLYMILDFLLVPAGAASLDELNEQQEAIEEEKKALKAQQQDLAAQRAALQSSINDLKNDISASQAQKEEYDRLIIVTEQELENLSQQIAVLEDEIEISVRNMILLQPRKRCAGKPSAASSAAWRRAGISPISMS